jgi:anti-anti-sigma factor
LLELKVEHKKDIALVKVSGKLFQEEATRLEEAISREIAGGRSKIIIDMTYLNFISSDGLSMLLEIRLRLQRKDGFIRLVCPPELIYEVFQRTKLNKIFQIFETFDQAVDGDPS